MKLRCEHADPVVVTRGERQLDAVSRVDCRSSVNWLSNLVWLRAVLEENDSATHWVRVTGRGGDDGLHGGCGGPQRVEAVSERDLSVCRRCLRGTSACGGGV